MSTAEPNRCVSETDTPELTADAVIVGAGPVGLTLANLLGRYDIDTLVVEQRGTLIDYPRGVGLDDEALRVFQSTGLIERILPHTTPNQIMRFVDGAGRLLAEMAPAIEDFGWPKRNGFVQPLVDAELAAGLSRFARVRVRWDSRVEAITQYGDSVSLSLAGPGGPATVRGRYAVGCDGGSSTVRQLANVSFDGTTSPTRWLVIDIGTDPLGSPNVEVGADPKRIYVSLSVAHGIRRFEFMLFDDETDEQAVDDTFVGRLLARFVPHPERVDIIRRRVYTHHSRIAGSFRRGRVLLAGDAAHLMPVWQGQGYNSGIRDANNLAWKLAAVVANLADDDLLDTYDVERRGHAKAMIDLSTMVGRIISPTDHRVARARDWLARAANAVPTVKRYVVQMRFKPMPRYERGAVVHAHPIPKGSPVGTLFIQPRVATRSRADALLDDVLGPWFAVVCWNNDPRALLGPEQYARWKAFGARFVALRPMSQLYWTGRDHPDVVVVGDRDGRLKSWFDVHDESVLFLRPDRFIAAGCIAQSTGERAAALVDALSLTQEGNDAACSLLHVTQPTARSPRAAGGSA